MEKGSRNTKKQFYFLGGLPRSGSTLLASLLSQNQDVYVSPTSALITAMQGAAMGFSQDRSTTASHVDGQLAHILRGTVDGMYAHVKEQNVIDKNRGWPAHIDKLREIFGEEPKIICTVRPVAECIASFVKLQKPENVRQYVRNIMDPNDGMVMRSYVALKHGFENHRKNLLFVEYDDLVNNPKHELGRIYDFLGIEGHNHDFNNIINPVIENDTDAWGIPGLHTIREKLGKSDYNPKELLGDDLWETYQGGEFWNDKPEPKREKKPLDFMLDAGLHGDFERGWKIAEQSDPEDNRAMFNKGWYLLRQGKLLEGMEHMDKGRLEDVFGNKHIGTPLPLWDGISKGTVLLNCEGGLGDQICNVRFAKDIASRGCKVVVSCSPELMPLLKDVEGVSSIISHGTNPLSVYHDFWVPSMSIVNILRYEYKNLSGKPYIKKIDVHKKKNKKLKVGIRWYGNPRFEHQQHRKFPSELMFGLLDNYGCDFYSLQRDEGAELKPDGVEQLKLDTWVDTAKSLSELDLVITSCTSVAHLSAAMGIQTWNIVPILPYYLWALPGETTPYYDSMRIFRQEKYGDWSDPFRKIKKELEKECDAHTLRIDIKKGIGKNNKKNLDLSDESDDEPKRRALELSVSKYLLDGNNLIQRGYNLQAVDIFRRIISITPNNFQAHGLLGDALISVGEYTEAERTLLKAIELNPDYSEAVGNLGNSYVVRGRNTEAEKCYKRAVELMPENTSNHSNLMLCLNYGAHSNKEIYEEHLKWADMHTRHLECVVKHENVSDKNKRLRIGYVSPDFRLHSVNYFFEPLLEAHDKDKVEIFCYAEVGKPDDVTKRLQGLADNWVSTVGMSDEEVTEKICSDRIDILVDLAGHTKNNRLLVFARKPAPVQVSWLGYANTTGIKAIDYRITDTVADPKELTDCYYSEKLVRLPKGFLCFSSSIDSPDVSLSPYKKNGYITFGSLSDSAKISQDVIKVWSLILKNVPDSRLFLKSRALAEKETRQWYLDMFEKFGINRNRIKFSGLVQSFTEHLDTYKNIDISLDTFPYSGTATTSEALWMGVPVITLAGDRFAGRTGASILTQVGLKDLITNNKEDYVKTAVELASDFDRINNLRNGLRLQMSKSQFFNKKEFARQIETAYRDMWRKWCTSINIDKFI